MGDRLLYSRAQARILLGGISITTLIRLERRGILKPVRFSATGQGFYARDNLVAAAGGLR